MIKVFQIDNEFAIIKWEGLEDTTSLAQAIQYLNRTEEQVQVKTINKELKG